MFPIDDELLSYMHLTGREKAQILLVETYAKAQGMWRDDGNPASYSDTLTLDMDSVVTAMAGPRRPQDLSPLADIPSNFRESLKDVYGIDESTLEKSVKVN